MAVRRKSHGRGPGISNKFDALIQGEQDELAGEQQARGAPQAGIDSSLGGTDDALERALHYQQKQRENTQQYNRAFDRTNQAYGAGAGSFGFGGGGSWFGGNWGRGDKNKPGTGSGNVATRPAQAAPAEAPAAPEAPAALSQATDATPPTDRKRRPPPGGFVRREDGTKANRQRPVAPGMGDGGMYAQMNYVRENYPMEWSQMTQAFFSDQLTPFQLNGLIGSLYQYDLDRHNRNSRRRDEEDE